MMPFDFMTLAQQCAPQISPITMAAIVRTESGFNPYAIGVVHGRLLRQPSNEAEAMASVRALEANGWNFSVGLAQVSHANWHAYGLSEQNAFEPCRNLAVGAAILQSCFASARHAQADIQAALRASLSCYSSGDFSTGYRTGYVQRVVKNAPSQFDSTLPTTVPAIAVLVAPRPSRPDWGRAPSDGQGGGQDVSAVVF